MARTNELEQQIAAIEAVLNKTLKVGGGTGYTWVSFPIELNPCPPRSLVTTWLGECGLHPSEVAVVPSSHGKRLALVNDLDNPSAPFPQGWVFLRSQGRLNNLDYFTHPLLLERYRDWLVERTPKH